MAGKGRGGGRGRMVGIIEDAGDLELDGTSGDGRLREIPLLFPHSILLEPGAAVHTPVHELLTMPSLTDAVAGLRTWSNSLLASGAMLGSDVTTGSGSGSVSAVGSGSWSLGGNG